jgi:MoxR-like ATPase
MTLCIDGLKSCFGLIVVGQSGTGKTTALRAFKGLNGQFYRTDDVTPAAFVSHDSSKTEEELQQDDLLPKIKHQTVLNPEMANWFSGDWDTRSDKWATLIRVMDGGGYTRNSGTQGERGYTGNYRFNFVGATTPLEERNWETMSHAGNRFLFHEMPAKADEDVYDDIYYSETEYGDKVRAIQEVVQDFLTDRWKQIGGPEAVDWPSKLDEQIGENLRYLSELVRHARAPADGKPESPHRLAGSLRNLARGHAILCGRREITVEDLEVCARVALSTMPAKRRPIVREAVQLQPGEELLRTDVMDRLEVSRPTAGKRMDLVDTLGIGATVKADVQGGQTKVLVPEPDFIWPDDLSFPSR